MKEIQHMKVSFHFVSVSLVESVQKKVSIIRQPFYTGAKRDRKTCCFDQTEVSRGRACIYTAREEGGGSVAAHALVNIFCKSNAQTHILLYNCL